MRLHFSSSLHRDLCCADTTVHQKSAKQARYNELVIAPLKKRARRFNLAAKVF